MAKEKNNKETKSKGSEVSQVKISSKSLTIIFCIVLGLILIAFYINYVNNQNEEKKWQSSYLLDNDTISLEIKNLDEVSQILSEAPTEYFVLITYTGNEDNYNLEEGLKSIIEEYEMSDSFYYLNVDSIINEDNYLTRINSTFNTDKIEKVPTILYFKNNELVDIVKRYDDNTINAADFQKLLDIYEY